MQFWIEPSRLSTPLHRHCSRTTAGTMPAVLSTMAHRFNVPVARAHYFGPGVGIGVIATRFVPTNPESHCFFTIVQGPMFGELVAIKRSKLPEDNGFSENLGSRRCGACGDAQLKAYPDPRGKRFRLCNRCKMIYYCSEACQREHWHVHAGACAEWM